MEEETRISLLNKTISLGDKTTKIWDTRSSVPNWVLLLQYVQLRSNTNKDYHGTRPSRKEEEEGKASKKTQKRFGLIRVLSDGRQQREQCSSSVAT